MDATARIRPSTPITHRLLAVVDWTVDPHAVVAAISARDEGQRLAYGVLVPARLHGIDWVGSPNASRPCAGRQLARVASLLEDAGIDLAAAWVGDPETVPAVADALLDWPAHEIVLIGHGRRLALGNPLALARRVARGSGLPVTRVKLPRPGRSRIRPRMPRAVHCAPAGS
jgi:hypothetical protein